MGCGPPWEVEVAVGDGGLPGDWAMADVVVEVVVVLGGIEPSGVDEVGDGREPETPTPLMISAACRPIISLPSSSSLSNQLA